MYEDSLTSLDVCYEKNDLLFQEQGPCRCVLCSLDFEDGETVFAGISVAYHQTAIGNCN